MAIVINGSGTVTGISVGGLPDGIVDAGTLATDSVDSAELIDGAIDTAHIAADQITSAILPAGSVLQVVQTVKSDTFTTTSTDWTNITGLTVNITPASTSNKVLVQVHLSTGNSSDRTSAYRITGGTGLFSGDSDSAGRVEATTATSSESTTCGQKAVSFCKLDSPSSTSEQTYAVQVNSQTSNTTTINRSECDTDAEYCYRTISTITVMEIAG